MLLKDQLFVAARSVRENAYAPYSNFKVGAAIMSEDGEVFVGCNVENVAYPEGTCAEAGAIAAMIASGGSAKITAVLVIADSPVPVTPCGGCRQKLAEFGTPNAPVFLADLKGIQGDLTIGDLLPGTFSQEHIAGTKDP